MDGPLGRDEPQTSSPTYVQLMSCACRAARLCLLEQSMHVRRRVGSTHIVRTSDARLGRAGLRCVSIEPPVPRHAINGSIAIDFFPDVSQAGAAAADLPGVRRGMSRHHLGLCACRPTPVPRADLRRHVLGACAAVAHEARRQHLRHRAQVSLLLVAGGISSFRTSAERECMLVCLHAVTPCMTSTFLMQVQLKQI